MVEKSYNNSLFQPEPELALPTEQPTGGDDGDCRAKIADVVRKHHHSLGATITKTDQRKHPLGASEQQSPLCEDSA